MPTRESITSETLGDRLQSAIARIEAYPDPAVWIHRFAQEHIREQADRLLARQREGEPLPLFGRTFAIKDNIDVAGVPTTAACPDFAYVPQTSAPVVDRLCRAGAIAVGKTNMDQFATGLVGVRSPYGACRNTFNPEYISGGSSSGSAVAVAAGLVDFALATDTAGSGRVPAAFNNIVGLKPSRGLISTEGVFPACRSLDCVAIMARTIDEAAAVFAVAEGFETSDPFARDGAQLRRSLDCRVDPHKFRFGVPSSDDLKFFGDRESQSRFRAAIDRAVFAGGTPIEIDYAPFRDAARLLYDGPWVAERLAAIKSFYATRPGSLLPVIRQIIGGAERFSAVDAFEGMYRLAELRRAADAEWQKMDVLLLPTAGTIYTIEQVEADPIRLNQNLGYYTNFVNLLDLCAVAVPNGFLPNGLPTGVSFIAPAGRDEFVLEFGRRFGLADSSAQVEQT